MNMIKFTTYIMRFIRILALILNESYLLALLLLISEVRPGMTNSTSVNFKSLACAAAGNLSQISYHITLSVILALSAQN